MRRHIVILALASLCAAPSPSWADQASAAPAHRERAAAAVRHRENAAAPARRKARTPGRKKPRAVTPQIAVRALLVVVPPAQLAAEPAWTERELELERPVAVPIPISGFVPALSTDDWRLLVAAGLSGFALVSPIAPAMGFPGLRNHQRPLAGLLCMPDDQLRLCLPAISVVKDPLYDRRWAGLSIRVFEARF